MAMPDSNSTIVSETDLDQRLSRWKEVQMPFNGAALTSRERQMIEKLVEACQYLGRAFWQQNDPDGLSLYQSLAASADPRDRKLCRLLLIHGGRFDLIDEHHAFAGDGKIPPGRALYPKDLTRAEIETYVAQHPEKRKELYDPYTVIERRDGELVGRPYHEVYQQFIAPAAEALRAAATLSDDPAFAEFLRKRADAMLTDDYFESDLLWMDLKDPKFDVIFAPYEVYIDDVLGVKGSYGAAVLVRNEEESKKLAVFQQYIADIQDALPVAEEYRPSKKGHVTPMEVMDAPFRSGDLRHGYQAVADNLPNDPKIHAAKGSKKIFFKNFMDARVNEVILPIAKRLMVPDQAAKATGDGYVTDVLMHEISHGLGPIVALQEGEERDIKECIGPVYSALEEAKADATGMFALKYLVDRGALPDDRLEEYYASFVAGIFRTLRFGTAEAHGRAEMMEFNYLMQEKAILREDEGRYRIDYARMPGAFAALTKELLEIEATGDRARAEAWFSRYDKMPADLKAALNLVSDVPVDVEPVTSFSLLPKLRSLAP
jgi:hypothetical protein